MPVTARRSTKTTSVAKSIYSVHHTRLIRTRWNVVVLITQSERKFQYRKCKFYAKTFCILRDDAKLRSQRRLQDYVQTHTKLKKKKQYSYYYISIQ